MCNLGKVKRIVEIPREKALLAYRAWKVGLQSLFRTRARTKWALGKVVRAQARPKETNRVGLHAFKDHRLRRRYYNGSSLILGTIKVWGTVIIHEYGYRATHAEIVRISKGKEFIPNELGVMPQKVVV